MSTSPKQYLALIHDLPCVLCKERGVEQTTPTQAHHMRHGAGMAGRSQDWLAMALCWECHQGPRGIHGDRSRFTAAKWTELDALAATVQAVMQ